MLFENVLHLPEAELHFLKFSFWVFGFELKHSIFEALHFRVFADRDFIGLNNEDLKPYWQILSRNLSEME